LEELLARMRPVARDEQLELDRAQAALAAVVLDEVQERAADALAAPLRVGDEQPELARVAGDVVQPHAADDRIVLRGDRDLPRPDQPRDLLRRRPLRALAPHPTLRRLVDDVDQLREALGERIVLGQRNVHASEYAPSQCAAARGEALEVFTPSAAG